MNERDEALKAFRKALAEAEQHAHGKSDLVATVSITTLS